MVQGERRPEEFSSRGLSKGVAYGVASITNVMQGIQFPISKQELIDCWGHQEINWTKSNPRRLSDLLERVPEENFSNITEITKAIGSVMKDTPKKTADKPHQYLLGEDYGE